MYVKFCIPFIKMYIFYIYIKPFLYSNTRDSTFINAPINQSKFLTANTILLTLTMWRIDNCPRKILHTPGLFDKNDCFQGFVWIRYRQIWHIFTFFIIHFAKAISSGWFCVLFVLKNKKAEVSHRLELRAQPLYRVHTLELSCMFFLKSFFKNGKCLGTF